MSVKRLISEDTFCTPNRPAKRSRNNNRSFTDQSPRIMIPASPFMKKLGYGTGVSVYLFERSPSKTGFLKSPWAVKKVKAYTTATADEATLKRLEREAELLQKFKHESIIGYRAFSRSADGTLCLSMENGEKSLLDLIETRSEHGKDPFPAKDILKVALAVAKALSYIHNEHKLLHGDLKSPNVLVQGDFEKIKLCDFGVSVKMKDDLSDVKDETEYYIGTEPWSAKEVVDEGTITDKTDIFAFGLVLWEMLALTIPHTHFIGDESNDTMDDTEWDETEYLEALGTRPPLPDVDYDDSYLPVLELLTMCTDENPKRRPTAKEIVDLLDSYNLQNHTAPYLGLSVKSNFGEDTFCSPMNPARRRINSILCRTFTADKSPAIMIPASPFMKKLGYGTGVSIYLFERGPHKTGFLKSPWAVKKVKAYQSATVDVETVKRLEREAELVQKFQHESIIGYRAFSRSADGTLCLSMENGEKSLLDLIEARSEHGKDPFPARDILKVAVAVTKALSYIHNEHKLLHGDIKSANVLIQGDFEKIKLCDFGVSVKMKEDLSDVKDKTEYYIGTEPWSAKEVVDEGKITDKTDIFAFGLVLWEMLALTIPHTHLLGDSDDSDDSMDDTEWDETEYLEALGTRPPLPDVDYDDSYLPVLELLTMCTDENPKRRPTAKEIVDLLDPVPN